jgi:hypothetical protein
MDCEKLFPARALRAEGRYRGFADLDRRGGNFLRAFAHRTGDEVTVWCSNDYLGMGQSPVLLRAMDEAVDRVRAGSGASAISLATSTHCRMHGIGRDPTGARRESTAHGMVRYGLATCDGHCNNHQNQNNLAGLHLCLLLWG